MQTQPNKSRAAFKIGDTIVRRADGQRLTVRWTSKGAADRREQLIATERNDYAHPYSDASNYEAA